MSNALKMLMIVLVLPAAMQLVGGCGSDETPNKNFYTSGNKEADERADQRMAQAQQLNSGGNSPLGGSKKPLFDRLGSMDGVQAITDDWVTRMLADPRVNFTRHGVVQGGLSIHHDRSMEWDANSDNVKALKAHFAQFLALASGGPAQYQGKDIKEAHTDMHISNDEFDASVGDLKATLDKLQVPNTEQKELLAIVESTRGEIVEER
jgi:hemoglobin